MIEPIGDHGLMFQPETPPPTDNPRAYLTYIRQISADAVAEAEDWLLDNGTSPVDIAALDLRGQVAWWGGEDRGFVQETHPGATLVIIVHVPIPDPPPETVHTPEVIPAEPVAPLDGRT